MPSVPTGAGARPSRGPLPGPHAGPARPTCATCSAHLLSRQVPARGRTRSGHTDGRAAAGGAAW